MNSHEICGNSFKELRINFQLKTKYVQHSIISRFRQRYFINSFNISEILSSTVEHLLLFNYYYKQF